MVNKKESRREEFTVRVGPLLRAILNKQRELIKSATYDCIESSDWEAGEIIAKKVESVL